jgi:hypothetical protein
MWQDENVVLNMPPTTPFYMAQMDLGLQPWFG